MKYSMLFVLILSACGSGKFEEYPKEIKLEQYTTTLQLIQEVIETTDSITPDGTPVSLNGYKLNILNTQDEVVEKCKSGSNVVGCTNLNDKNIYLVWLMNGVGYSSGILAHEMGHIYYHETTGDWDYNHKHTEWFSELPNVDSVRNQVYETFKNYTGN